MRVIKYDLTLITFIVSVLIFASIICLDVIKPVSAQDGSYHPKKFTVYENSDYKIRILHPSDWKVLENNLSPHEIVGFAAPAIEEEISSVNTNIFVPANVFVFADPIENKTMTLSQYFEQFMKDYYSSARDYKIVNASSTTFLGLPAIRTVLFEYKNTTTYKVMRIVTLANDTAYRISYYAEPGSFNEYLSTAHEMIDSFETNYEPPPTQISKNSISSEFDSKEIQTNLSSIITNSDFSLENNKDAIDLSKLPQSLTMIVESRDTDFPLGAVIGPNSSVQTETISDIPSSTFKFRDWNPKFTFQFIQGSAAGLQVVKSVLIGQIKSYDSIQDALINAKLWRDIPLNEQAIMRLDHKGLNFIIVEVDFTNSLYGLYSGVFDMQTALDKKFSNDRLRDDLREDKSLHVIPTSEHNTKKDTYWDAVKPLVCNDLSSFGFKVCD